LLGYVAALLLTATGDARQKNQRQHERPTHPSGD